ncbi:DUF4349 domain-containing protein [Pseudoflavitalea sp. G-6-1-2]|uniref:DUF4349 domain-containing protein n=1 Tax=Pseudoflavitalea sp. G-6-1-2 TaxID=2728841 RepID=UPI00146DC18F|nr:DUF4349 domain-containing protein [Pseudoflavitalea sp. G-6-1-2]NML23929.1 DUF4349 domain-containing protein [Pseudoflavitalea sp. G-6-1-2]
MKTLLTVSAFMLVLASSCDHKNANQKEAAATAPSENAKSEELVVASATDSAAGYEQLPMPQTVSPENQPNQPQPQQKNNAPAPAPVKADWNRKIIRHGDLELEVKDFKNFNNRVSAIAGKYGGYISEETQESSDYRLMSKVTLRVPVDQFEAAVNELSSTAEKQISRNITSQDVTGQVVDLRSRLEAKRQARLRYLELMKSAKNMEEVFQVQKEVDEIQEEIEAAAGRVSQLSNQSAYSTITVVFFQIIDPSAPVTDKSPSFGDRLLEALGSGFKWFGDVVIALLTLWPLWTIAILGVYGYRKWRKQRPAKPATVAESPVK